MHDCQDDNVGFQRRLHQTIWKPVEAVTPNATAEQLPRFGVLLDPGDATPDFVRELKAEAGLPPVVTLTASSSSTMASVRNRTCSVTASHTWRARLQRRWPGNHPPDRHRGDARSRRPRPHRRPDRAYQASPAAAQPAGSDPPPRAAPRLQRLPQGHLILGGPLLLVSRNACRPQPTGISGNLYQPGFGPRAQSIAVKAGYFRPATRAENSGGPDKMEH